MPAVFTCLKDPSIHSSSTLHLLPIIRESEFLYHQAYIAIIWSLAVFCWTQDRNGRPDLDPFSLSIGFEHQFTIVTVRIRNDLQKTNSAYFLEH